MLENYIRFVFYIDGSAFTMGKQESGPESSPAMASSPMSISVMAAIPESCPVMAGVPESRLIMAAVPKPYPIMATMLSAPLSVRRYPRVASRLEDPTPGFSQSNKHPKVLRPT